VKYVYREGERERQQLWHAKLVFRMRMPGDMENNLHPQVDSTSDTHVHIPLDMLYVMLYNTWIV
jgi:hypothetical protein